MSTNHHDPLDLARKRNLALGIVTPCPEDGHEHRLLNRAERRAQAKRARRRRPKS